MNRHERRSAKIKLRRQSHNGKPGTDTNGLTQAQRTNIARHHPAAAARLGIRVGAVDLKQAPKD